MHGDLEREFHPQKTLLQLRGGISQEIELQLLWVGCLIQMKEEQPVLQKNSWKVSFFQEEARDCFGSITNEVIKEIIG